MRPSGPRKVGTGEDMAVLPGTKQGMGRMRGDFHRRSGLGRPNHGTRTCFRGQEMALTFKMDWARSACGRVQVDLVIDGHGFS